MSSTQDLLGFSYDPVVIASVAVAKEELNECPSSSKEIKFSEVISALSYALDLTEGQPLGHSIRSCLIGMRLAEEIQLPEIHRPALFYALLLKDAGCSSNAAKVCSLFGADDHALKQDLKTTNWSRLWDSALYVARGVQPDGSPLQRALKFIAVGLHGPAGARKLTEIRCERGAEIVRMLDFPEETAEAIRSLDEHWDGKGHPYEVRGEEIPLLGRILGIAQTVEVFLSTFGLEEAQAMAETRRGKWFDPRLIDALRPLWKDAHFWSRLDHGNLNEMLAEVEPSERGIYADDARLDQVAHAFAQVIDAKSPYTFKHSEGVAEIAMGIGQVLGFSKQELRDIRRAGLLHDIGKLGVSNQILDKPGKLTDEEREKVRLHPLYTLRILERVACFQELAGLAAAHHERIDGKGYHQGLAADAFPLPWRVLAVADICEALMAERPYRAALPVEKVLEIMQGDVGKGICPASFEGLQIYLQMKAHLSKAL